MEGLFKEFEIYSAFGQRYVPVDAELLLSYAEGAQGQILEEGITEAGSMASLAAAGTSYSTFGEFTVPFYIFYSMFGFQRTMDQIWAFADMRGRGFLLGATAGRTTLTGEGLQHDDGHSLLLASAVPTVQPYDPAFAYEVAVVIQDGLRRMYSEGEDVFYYVTVYNENYAMPPMPDGAREGVLRGLYRYRASTSPSGPRVQLFGSGPILRCVLEAQEILGDRYGVAADAWSATSYTLLRREALDCEQFNREHPDREPRVPLVTRLLEGADGPVIAASDWVKAVPDQITRWVPGGLESLGTDGFGRSDTREALRRHFRIDAASIVVAALARLARDGKIARGTAAQAASELGIDREAAAHETPDPARQSA
jgi:pyruvate dehydrogenase E1 component